MIGRGAARAAAGAALLLALAGCSWLPKSPAGGAPAASPAASAPRIGAVSVEIEAPDELKALLERHLDLVRLGRIERSDVDDSEWSRLIDASPAQVRDLLQTEGYFAPTVDLERTGTQSVKLIVTPGRRATVSRVTFEVQGALQEDAARNDPYAASTLAVLRSAWAMPAGHEFRNADWSDAKATALARLRAAGYATAFWSGTSAEVDPATQTVRLFVVADSGPLFRVGELQVEGLDRQDAETVRNLANTRAGTPATETLMLDFQDRLQKSGLFEAVSVTLDTDPERAAAAPVLVRLRETPLQVWTFGLGVSNNAGPRASVEHTWRRVFGYAATSRNKVEWGQKRQAWDGELSGMVGPGLYRNLVGGAVENLETDSDTVLSQRLRVGRAQDAPRLERLFFLEAERSVRTPATGTKATTLSLSGNFHGGWRDLDNVVLPTEGATLQVQLGLGQSRSTGADTGPFTRAYGRLVGYRPLGGSWYGQARVELGRVFARSTVTAPDSQLFRAGGDESVRGYSFRSLGPLVDGSVGSGRVLMTGSLEVARPVSRALPSVWGALFIDAGNAADSMRTLDPVIGYGIGVRWRSPVGPLRLDYAWANETRKGRIHFSVGIAF
jgi:translocation and assembly module TamA